MTDRAPQRPFDERSADAGHDCARRPPGPGRHRARPRAGRPPASRRWVNLPGAAAALVTLTAAGVAVAGAASPTTASAQRSTAVTAPLQGWLQGPVDGASESLSVTRARAEVQRVAAARAQARTIARQRAEARARVSRAAARTRLAADRRARQVLARKAAEQKAAEQKAAAQRARAQRAAAQRASAQRVSREAAARRAAARQAHGWQLPVRSYRWTSRFGMRWGRLHAGDDFAAPVGTPAYAMSSGTVVFAGQQSGYGTKLEIRYWDGTVSWYGHLSSIDVRVGEQVAPGEVVGATGNSGRSTGPHLHLEIHPGGGDPVDPASWLAQRGVDI